jgi:hypothetical protein
MRVEEKGQVMKVRRGAKEAYHLSDLNLQCALGSRIV